MIITPDGHHDRFIDNATVSARDLLTLGRVVNGDLEYGSKSPMPLDEVEKITGIAEMILAGKSPTNGASIIILRRTARWFLEQTQEWEDGS